jgi:serine/threonine protein phosphatase PrpC
MTGRKICFSAFLLPKSDSTEDECQDAICTPTGCDAHAKFEHTLDQNGSPLRFAVADGLATAFYSGYWAKQLVELFRDEALSVCDNDGPAWKQKADDRWQKYMGKRTLTLGSISRNRLAQCDPAAATFCGIEIKIEESGPQADQLCWRVIAVGDSCVIHLSSNLDPGRPFISYPCNKASDFSCITQAISSYETNHLPEKFKVHRFDQNTLKDGDVLLLATDALCEWMIRLADDGSPVWRTVVDLNEDDGTKFKHIVEQARRECKPDRLLKDDDVALIIVRVGDTRPEFLANAGTYEAGDLLQTRAISASASDFIKLLSPNVVHALPEPEKDELRTTTPKQATGDHQHPDSQSAVHAQPKPRKRDFIRQFPGKLLEVAKRPFRKAQSMFNQKPRKSGSTKLC